MRNSSNLKLFGHLSFFYIFFLDVINDDQRKTGRTMSAANLKPQVLIILVFIETVSAFQQFVQLFSRSILVLKNNSLLNKF